MEFNNCKYAEFTNRQWFGTPCTIIKCRHPDSESGAFKFNNHNVLQLGIFQGLDGIWIDTNEDCMYRRSMFCNKDCPGYENNKQAK